MSNYPDGVRHSDKAAPWNQAEQEMEDCEHCGGSGFVGHDCGEDTCCCLNPEENIKCDRCKGDGVVEFHREDF